MRVDATIDKSLYLLDENMKISFSFNNVTTKPFVIDPFPPEIRVMRASPYDERVRSFPASTGTRALNPGEATNYVLTWDQRDNKGQQVAYGHYYLELGYVRSEGGGTRTLSFSGKRLLILPAEGVLEKTITVNSTQTVNGITVTLERVELSATEIKVYVFNIPPGFSLPQGPQLPPPSMMIHAEAEHRLDGGAVKRTGPSGIRFLQNGMEHIWDNLDPVPKSTREFGDL